MNGQVFRSRTFHAANDRFCEKFDIKIYIPFPFESLLVYAEALKKKSNYYYL